MTQRVIPLSVPNFIGKEEEYVTDAVQSTWVSTGGAYVTRFEVEIANYLQVNKAAAVQSGTAGIHLALKVAGIESDHEVIVPTLTFIAAVNPVRYVGAEPIFMDCDDSLNMDLDKLEDFCKNECYFKNKQLINKKSEKVIKAIVIVHIFGNIADMEKLMAIASKYNLKVIEDATEALGSFFKEGLYKDKFAGTIGDFGIYSFNGNKIITTGGGGAVVSNNEKDLIRVKHLSTQAKEDPLYYKHDAIGYNYRMTNLQAALGVAQLENLEKFIGIKNFNHNIYKSKIDKIEGLELLEFKEETRSNKWFYSLLVNASEYGMNRDELLLELKSKGIQTRPIWGLIHHQKPYHDNQAYKIEKAKYYQEKVLNIPCSVNLGKSDIDFIIQVLEELKSK